MAKKELPLQELSIEELFNGNDKCVYEIPVYQRNYAWEKDEIAALVQDVYDAFKKDRGKPYYIGTLVSYHKGDQVYEIIDGQQRLTTIRILLDVLEIYYRNSLTYRARKKSDDTLKAIPNFNKIEEKDSGIENGYKYAKAAVGDLGFASGIEKADFVTYFKTKVHIIHYKVPKDIDLNHYFEIMNSRGEQLEKHEIVKANLMQLLNDDEKRVFNLIWEACSEMSVYVQQTLADIRTEDVFGYSWDSFIVSTFDEILDKYKSNTTEEEKGQRTISIIDIINAEDKGGWAHRDEETEKKDTFQPIIDFPNFLLIVLKITRMNEQEFSPIEFNLDDKELLNEFKDARMDATKTRRFAYNLLKARYLLDNYICHHSKEEDTIDNKPWKVQVWQKDLNARSRKGYLKNLTEDKAIQERLTHLLSMFEVSFTARQRKNYLFYCLLYLLKSDLSDIEGYTAFVEALADRYFNKVYLDGSKLNAINTPLPGSFDETILDGHDLNQSAMQKKGADTFTEIYGDGTVASRGVPLFIFNYLDFKIWDKYDTGLRGERLKEESRERREFFNDLLGCDDFGLKVFDQFYFSRTRRSLEHYYPQANATGEPGFLDKNQINCLGNFAMIGSDANSSGSNWTPKTKLDHYLDSSKKISQISVASLKFMIMMQMCKDKGKWEFNEIQEHQKKMVELLLKG